MYTAFQLSNIRCPEEFEMNESAYSIFAKQFDVVNEKLKHLLSRNEIDGSAIQDLWFPEIKADIFISHSHQDKDMDAAIFLQSWLKTKFNLTAFIDSTVWYFADDLLKELDLLFCWQSKLKTYNYERRNKTTTHVHMMLATALTKMVDACECVFFLNTPQSISIKKGVKEITYSPWIYYELSALKTIRKRPQEGLVRKNLSEQTEKNASLPIYYPVNIKELPCLNVANLCIWGERCSLPPKKGSSALDELYSLYSINQLGRLRAAHYPKR